MSIESLIADCHRRGYRVGDLAELRDPPGQWRARLWTPDDRETDFSTGRTAEIALKNALAEITAAPGSERARAGRSKATSTATSTAPKSTVPVPRSPTPPLPSDIEDLLAL